MSELRPGELLMLGFKGDRVPAWLRAFARDYGLGGVILFDYDCTAKRFGNNVVSPAQVRDLCAELAGLAAPPLVFVDQEGGRVRRLKDTLGFAPLPSARAYRDLPAAERLATLERSFREQRELGIHFDLAPVVDLDLNPANPDIGKIERSFSDRADVVRRCVREVAAAARGAGLGLCLKHYPGLGGARVNSHLELTDLTGLVPPEQVELFHELVGEIPGEAILVSHGILREWDPSWPVSMSDRAIGPLRRRQPEALLVSDDLQMQGLQLKLGSGAGILAGLRAGLDLMIVGNNLIDEQAECARYAEAIAEAAARDAGFAARCARSAARVADRKRRFM